MILLILKHIPVPRLPIHKINHCLIRLLHAALLNPWLNLLVRGKLQHLRNLSWRADSRATDLDATTDEREGVDWGKFAAVRSTDSRSGCQVWRAGKEVTYPT
jgi:hypothetical protein